MVTHALGHMSMSYYGGHRRIDNNRKGTLSVLLTTYIYYAHLTFVGFEHSVCHESLLTSFTQLYI